MANNNKTSKNSKASKKPTTKVISKEIKPIQANKTVSLNKVESSKNIVSSKQETSAQETSASTSKSKLAELFAKPDFQKKAFAVVAGLIFISIVLSISFVYIYHVLDNTDEAIATRIRKQTEEQAKQTADQKAKQLADENTVLKIDSTNEWKIAMDFKDFGVVNLNLKKEYAPATVENFVRLVSRKFYDGNKPHRIVEVDNFKVLQGGDPKGDGSGGETASGNPVPDEIWKEGKAPQFTTVDGKQVLSNTPELRAPSLYSNFNTTTGQITYRKGLILMAKTSAPNSASSQYFITLDTTILPADYTVFGTVEDSSLQVLDKILNTVKPVIAEGADAALGGKPDPELTTSTVKIVSQS